jgi:hypothetical protein
MVAYYMSLVRINSIVQEAFPFVKNFNIFSYSLSPNQ